jgi:hypothetical protein
VIDGGPAHPGRRPTFRTRLTRICITTIGPTCRQASGRSWGAAGFRIWRPNLLSERSNWRGNKARNSAANCRCRLVIGDGRDCFR